MSLLIVMAALAAQLASAQEAAPLTNETVSPAMATAMANKARAKTAPSFIKEPDYLRPEAAKLAGEFGEVVLYGIIGADGKFTEAKVAISSRSPGIDAAALASVPTMLFEPARDADGHPLSIPANLPLDYSQVDWEGLRGLGQYQCAQFARDYDWWYRTWPADKQDRGFKTLRGIVAMAHLTTGKRGPDFDVEWKQAIEACRKAPNKLMLDMLKPDGTFIRAMVRK